MRIGIFTDKKHMPDETEVLEAVAPQRAAWEEMIQYVREHYPVQEDFKFLYGKNYGWARRFLLNNKLLIYLYPSKSGFTAQINLPEAAVQHALCEQTLGARVLEVIAAAKAFPEGRWLFIPVNSTQDIADVKRLLALRVETRLQVKSAK